MLIFWSLAAGVVMGALDALYTPVWQMLLG